MNLAQRARRITSLRQRARKLQEELYLAAIKEPDLDGRLACSLRAAAVSVKAAQARIETAVTVARRERREAGERALPK